MNIEEKQWVHFQLSNIYSFFTKRRVDQTWCSAHKFSTCVEEPSTEKYQPPTLNRVHATEARVKSPHEGPTHGHSGDTTNENIICDISVKM